MEAGSCLSLCKPSSPVTGLRRFGTTANGSMTCKLVVGFLIAAAVTPTDAADQRTQNFLVYARTPGMAKSVAEAAEKYRHDLAVHWLGRPLPAWPAPCPIRVVDGPNLAAQGVTTYNPQPVRDFQMEVVGTPERILDSVLPHEVTHTILATHFGRPLPRWADEGICTTVEHAAERNKHEVKLREFLSSRRGIAMNKLFLMTEYPSDVLPMYAQGYSVCRFLIAQKGPRTFIQFLQDYMQRPSWTANVKKHYDYDSLRELQEYWLAWVDEGSADVTKFSKINAPGRTSPLGDDGPPARLASQTGPKLTGPKIAGQSIAGQSIAGPATRLALTDPRGFNRDVRGGREPSAAQPAPETVASVSDSGWYQRRRDGVASGSNAGALRIAKEPKRDRTLSPISPPSVRESGRYSVAQPQPEQQISRVDLPADRRWPPKNRRY